MLPRRAVGGDRVESRVCIGRSSNRRIRSALACRSGRSRRRASGALLRRDGGEVRPALLDILAAAVRADDLSLLVFGDGQTLRKCLLAGVTEELVLGH